MQNSDLIAFLKPVKTEYSRPGSVELLDVTGQLRDIAADASTLWLRFSLPAGRYRGRIVTKPGAFDMGTASIDMLQVPDGKRVPLGPWDLDHIHNVMAMPMARTLVNGELKGGLWFSMPGPEEIQEGKLVADFGFDAPGGACELQLELIERDRERMDWGRLDFIELRTDDRRDLALLPRSHQHPRIFFSAAEAKDVLTRWQGSEDFSKLREQLIAGDLQMLTDNSQGTMSLACVFYAVTGDGAVGARARSAVMELADASTWSGRPDPLLMGGENDRGISLRLFHIALAWDHLQPLLSEDDRAALLAKAEEYLRKIYDFTVLQRAYMGCPAIDPHSLGSWNGPAIACMAFHEELPIARRALPFFHGLMCDSLTLFPASGKAAWATYFPFHLVLYLAAAHTFAGAQPEFDRSEFLDHLGAALLASFEAPNSQELQRGLRTKEHRFLTAFLARFHPTPGVEAIYRAFAARERAQTGELTLGIFDLLYAPSEDGEHAAFAERPLFARDVGDILATSRGEHVMALLVSGGNKVGQAAGFGLMPQNREFAPSLGALEVAMDGWPVICNINISCYGINSALTNAMCFERGDGGVTNGQYLNGAVRPEQCSLVRRCCIGERFVYAHLCVAGSLEPSLAVEQADRVVIFDRRSGAVIVSDAFAGARALQFATHLHCSGTVTEVGPRQYKLTGGQANLIAGIKRGEKGMKDDEFGEVFVEVLRSSHDTHVLIEEPTWIPGYIYGLNYTGKEEMSEGRYPRYQRWRLETRERGKHGSFVISMGPAAGLVKQVDGAFRLSQGGVYLGFGWKSLFGMRYECECLLWDDASESICAVGTTSVEDAEGSLSFAAPVDVEYSMQSGHGTIYSHSARALRRSSGFEVKPWEPVGEDGWKTHCGLRASFVKAKG